MFKESDIACIMKKDGTIILRNNKYKPEDIAIKQRIVVEDDPNKDYKLQLSNNKHKQKFKGIVVMRNGVSFETTIISVGNLNDDEAVKYLNFYIDEKEFLLIV